MTDFSDPDRESEPTETPLNLDEAGEEANPDRDLPVPIADTVAGKPQTGVIDLGDEVPTERSNLKIPGFLTGIGFSFDLLTGQLDLYAGSREPTYGLPLGLTALVVIAMLLALIFAPQLSPFILAGAFVLLLILVARRRGDGPSA